jgi:hypothetical protein
MKKLLAAFCSVFFFNSFSQVPHTNEVIEQKASGQRVLIKAIAVIVNTDANKKAPAKRIYVASSECP